MSGSIAVWGLVLGLSVAGQVPTSEMMEEAKKYFDAGWAAYEASDYLNAARAFEHAHGLIPNPAISFSIAQSYRLQYFSDRKPETLLASIRNYRRYLEQVEKGGRRDDALEHVGALEQQRIALGIEVTPEAPKARLTQLMITSQTEDARAEIDGYPTEEVPVIREVPPGTYSVRVEAPGYYPQAVIAVAVEGQFVVKEVNLQEQPALVRISAPDESEVTIDGRFVGRTPFSRPVRVPPGTHFIAITQLGRHPHTEEVELQRGQEVSVVAKLETTTQRDVSYYFLGIGGAAFLATGVAVAVGLGSEGQARLILRKRDTDGVNLTIEERDDYIRARDRRNDLLGVSSVGLVGSAVLAGIGAALYLFDQPRVTRVGMDTSVSPLVSADTVGAVWSGSF